MIDRFTRVEKLRMYAHKVLPLVYDDSLSYYEYLCKVVQKVNEVIENDGEQSTTIEEFAQVLDDMQEEIDSSLESMQGQVDTAVGNAEQATRDANASKEAADLATQAANTAAEHAEATAVKYGTPYAVNDPADMTDHDYIYVYTGTTGDGFTQGNWYYWNGTAWTSGGLYVGDITDAVLFNAPQSKTDAEKAQARSNAGAADANLVEHVIKVESYTQNEYYTNWTIGRAEAGFNNNLSWCCYSDMNPTDGTVVYFDDTVYKVAIAWFDTSTQEYASTLGGWVTTSPVTLEGGRAYNKINMALKSTSGDINTSDVSEKTYKINTITPHIVSVVKPYDTCYVSASDGSDSNDGTIAEPFATIQKAINSGFGRIFVEPGNYAPISLINREYPITISMYNKTQGTREKIKIVATNEYYGVVITNCKDVTLNDVWIYNAQRYALDAENNGLITLNDCIADHNEVAGFSLFYFANCDSICNNCIAYNSMVDGFNYHGEGDSTLINCVSYDNADDGVSHHEKWRGVIIGGHFYGNGKAGIAPYSGSDINIYNACCTNNTQFGLYIASNGESDRTKSIASGCACKNNGTADIYVNYADAIGFSNIYATKTVGDNGVFTEIT